MIGHTDSRTLPTASFEQLTIPKVVPEHVPAEIVAILLATMCQQENRGTWAGFARSDIQEFARTRGIYAQTVNTGLAAMRAASQVEIKRGRSGESNDVIYPTRSLIYLLFAATPIAV